MLLKIIIALTIKYNLMYILLYIAITTYVYIQYYLLSQK